MSGSRVGPLVSWFIRIIVISLLPLAAWAEDLEANRTEIVVGETATLRIPGGMGLFKPSWKASPKGIVEFEDKGEKKAVVRGVALGRASVSAKVLGSTYSVDLTVTDKPKIKGWVEKTTTTTGGGDTKPIPPATAGFRAIGDLLTRYETELGSIRTLFDKTADKDHTPGMGELTERKLAHVTEKFFQELAGMGFSVRDLQQFKEQYKAAGPGGSPLFPGQGAWDDAFLGTERALMMGRAQLVQRLWRETLQDTFKNNPDAAVFGEIDIGSWVKMRLGDLGFQADIDFSSVAIDPDLNRWIVQQFEDKLRQHTSLDMVQADALLTAHGQATADVFIGDWGKTFAELDMLKRSKWKVIKVEKNPDGSLALDENGRPKIRMIEKPGAQLFWEVAFRKLEAVMAANGGKLPHQLPNPHEFEVDHPKMGLDKEPMLSLEMLRHGIHDIEHGPYSRGQKLIKMLKYAERSYFMSKKAVAAYGFNPYDANNPKLARAAEVIIANKNDPALVADVLQTLAGEEITPANVDEVTNRLVADAKTVMHDNAARALAFRLNAIARIDADDARQKAAEKLWTDLGTELDTFRDTVGDPPRIMVDAQEMAKAVMEGKLPPAELEAKANELHKLLNDAYKLPDSVIDRILMSDSVLKLKAYLRKLGWIEKSIDEFANKAKQKFPNVANFHGKVMELNAQLEKTTSGSGLLKAADWADNAFTVYDAYLNSDASEALLNASIAMGRVGVQSYFPSMQIPFAVYDSLKSGSPKPLGMAVAFMYFPFAGQTYMVSGLMQRADVGIRDTEFYNALNKVLETTEFNAQGQIIGFSLRNIIGKEIDSESIPPGNRKAIVALFTKPDSTFFTSPNFRYWSSLVPKQDDRFGRYENKLQNLRRFFGLSEDVRYMTVMLENFKAKSNALPQDKFTAQRQAALERMETQLTETLWIAMADMLESAARSVNVGELETKVKKYEEDLSLGDDDLGKNKGLIARIKQEIRQNSSLLRGENPYAVALIYDKYIKAYERVEALRKQIVLDVWHGGFGIDYVAAQGKPMKVLLLGGKSGAPVLSGDPAKDVELAENTLAAHRARAQAIRADLTTALDRAVDAEKDKDYLKALGQIGLEWEHLLDDCAGRAAPNCEAGVRTALQQRVKLYKDYLAKLAAGNQAMTLEITGPAEMKLGESADFSAKFAKPEDKSRPGLTLNWSVNGQSAGTGEKMKVKAEQAGGMNLMLSATSKASGGEKKLGEAVYTVTVKDPSGGKPPVADAKLAAEIDSALKARDWKRLVALLAQVKQNEQRRIKDTAAWQADVDAVTRALDTLKKERMQWALAWKDYMDALDHIDSLTWDKLTRAVDRQRDLAQERCYKGSSSSEDPRKRDARCQKEASKFYDTCLGEQPKLHFEERQRIRMAKEQLPDKVQSLHSAGWFTHKDWFEAVEKLADEFKLPFPWPNPVTPRLKYAASCASVDLPAGQKKPTTADFKVTVNVPQAIVPYGKAVTLSATAQGGKAPHSYAWSTGASGQRASVTPRWAGEWTVTVTATDADGKTGEGQGTLVVSPAKFKMNGTQPQVFYGSQATLSLPGKEPPPPAADPCAGRSYTGSNPFDECLRINVKDLKSVSTASPGTTAVPVIPSDVNQVQALPETSAPTGAGKQRVDWESDAALVFAPPSSGDGRTQVTYSSMGQVKVWCAILEEIEGAFHTVGECDQEVVNVVAPSFSVSFTPPEGQGRIGQDIRLRIDSQPGVADELINFRWLDPATSNRLELTTNAREIAFKVKDAKPVVLKVLALVPKSGDSIADIGATYTGLQFEVKAWVEEPGTRPMMWDPVKGGLKPVPKGQYATHERIPLRAELQGGGAPSGLRWNWTVNDGTTISNPISQTPTVSRSSPGGIQAHVEARDSEGAVLGSTDVSASVIEVRDTPPAPVNPTVSLYADRTSAERGEIVSFSANATGGKPPYRYVWQGASGQDAHATLATTRTGNQAVSVTVTDSKGKTGTARMDISVVASARDIAKEKAGKLAAQASQQAKAGDFEGAANTLDEASRHDADTARPAAMQIRDQAKQAAAAAEKKRDFKTSGRLFEAAKRIDRNDQDAHIGANNAVAYQQRQDGMVAKQRELAGHIARGDWHLAETSQAELKIIDEGLPGGLTPETRDLIKRYQDGQAAYTRQVDAKRKEIAADIQAKRYGSARAKLAALRQTHLIPADEDWARGISTVIDQAEAESQTKSGAGAITGAGVSAIAGKWRSSEGEVTLTQSGRGVKGGYTSDGGEIVGEMNGNVLEGYWIENSSGERCATAKNGRHHWGRIRWTFDGGKFVGNWSYCDKPVAGGGGWTGERSGDVPAGYVPPAGSSSNSSSGTAVAGGKSAGATSNEEWAVVETTPGMYRLERSASEARVARQANNPGGLQYAGLRLNRGLPASGDFSAQVGFADARIDGGLNQIELQATFADGAIFYVVRDRERGGGHIWAPNLQGDAPCGKAGVLRMERRGETVTGYCDGRAIWSAPRKAALIRLQFVLQNNVTNDPISVTFRDWRFSTSAGASLAGASTSTSTATSVTANASGLAGAWAINAKGYTGKVELSESGGRLSGRVWFDATRVWEDLRDFSFDGRTLRFLRPGPNQRYTGTYSGNEVRGSFDGGGTWNWSMTRTGAAVAPSGTPRIAEFAWHGMDEDRVGDWGNGKPNGTKDGHFRLTLDASGQFALATLSVWSSNEKGEKSGGQIWHTRNGSNWMLGVFRDGRQLNASHVASLGEFPGRITLDLYANSSGWFNPGQWFLLEVESADGKVARQTLRLGDAPNPTAAGRVNLARGKPASQSSTSEWSRANDAQGAVDGVINGGYAFHTGNRANPWWQVDLGAPYRLSEVRLYNRLDCCGERARTVQILLSEDGRAWRTAYRHNGSVFGGKDGKPLVVSLNGETARHVRLQLNEPNWFHLDEVEVMGWGEASNPPIDGGRDYTYQDGGRDHTYRDQAAPTTATAPSAAADAQSQEEAGKQLKDAVKELKNLFKW
jgi:hypothetical protein